MTIGRFFNPSIPRARRALAGVAAVLPGFAPVQTGFAAERAAPAATHPAQACSSSTRSVRQLAMIDHTSDGGFQCLGVYVEGDTVKAIRLERHSFASSNGQPGQERIKVIEFPPAIAATNQGVVIDGIPGHDAIVLRGRLDTSSDRGEFRLSYLYNGLTGEYHSCPIALNRTQGDGWRLVNRFDQPISLIMVRIREVPMIGVIGIANLEGACT